MKTRRLGWTGNARGRKKNWNANFLLAKTNEASQETKLQQLRPFHIVPRWKVGSLLSLGPRDLDENKVRYNSLQFQ